MIFVSEFLTRFTASLNSFSKSSLLVIHFSNYFKIAEEALYAGLNRLGFSFGNFEYAISVISTQANYYQPIKFADHISVIITDIEIQQERLIFNFAFNNSDYACITETQLTFVLIETKNRKTIKKNIPEAEALKIMEDKKINAIVVVNDDNTLTGAINMHDLLRAGVV